MKHSIIVEGTMELIGYTTKTKLPDIWRDGSTWNDFPKPVEGITIKLRGVKNQTQAVKE